LHASSYLHEEASRNLISTLTFNCERRVNVTTRHLLVSEVERLVVAPSPRLLDEAGGAYERRALTRKLPGTPGTSRGRMGVGHRPKFASASPGCVTSASKPWRAINVSG
jgi:hypothetical protein